MKIYASIKTQKLDYNDEDQALEILKRFKERYLHDNINELVDFSFWNILEDKGFNGVSSDGNKFDGDRTRIVYAIDFLLYHNKIFDLSLGDAKYHKKFSGDTIHTFRTLFGNRFTTSQYYTEEYVENFFNFTPEQIQKKNQFFRTYQKIGNFYILPNGKSKITGQSINKYRGTDNNYKDFFDVFFNNLYTDNDELLTSLRKEEINKNFFSAFPDLKSFCEVFYLDLKDYESLDFEHPKTKNGTKCNLRNFKTLGIDKSKYLDFAFDYIEKATKLIDQRSAKLVEVLKTNYPELTQQ